MPMRTEAEDAPAVDTSRWACKFCPFEEGFSASVELGGGYVSDDSFKFGEYTGLNQQGAFAVANADARYRNRDGRWLDLSATDLGLDSRSLNIAGGKQGSYRLSFGYKELPHNISDTALSPFLGVGTGSLTLPSGWIPGATTGTLPVARREPQWRRSRDEAPSRRFRSRIDSSRALGIRSQVPSRREDGHARHGRLIRVQFVAARDCRSITTPIRSTFRRPTTARDFRRASRTTDRYSRTMRMFLPGRIHTRRSFRAQLLASARSRRATSFTSSSSPRLTS